MPHPDVASPILVRTVHPANGKAILQRRWEIADRVRDDNGGAVGLINVMPHPDAASPILVRTVYPANGKAILQRRWEIADRVRNDNGGAVGLINVMPYPVVAGIPLGQSIL